jgi:hypothetical protein
MGLSQQLYEIRNQKKCRCGALISRKSIMCRRCQVKYNPNLGNKGKKFSLEHREKISKARMGMKLTPEAKLKISIANSGRKFSNEINKKKGLSMEKNYFWKGGKKKHEFGYILIKTLDCPELPRNKQGYIKRANLVWYKNTNEIIKKPFVLHHIDKNPENDNFKNLQKLTFKEHAKMEYKLRKKNNRGEFV